MAVWGRCCARRLLGKQAIEFVRISGVVPISPKAGVLAGQVEVFENHPFDGVGAQDLIQIHLGAVKILLPNVVEALKS